MILEPMVWLLFAIAIGVCLYLTYKNSKEIEELSYLMALWGILLTSKKGKKNGK